MKSPKGHSGPQNGLTVSAAPIVWTTPEEMSNHPPKTHKHNQETTHYNKANKYIYIYIYIHTYLSLSLSLSLSRSLSLSLSIHIYIYIHKQKAMIRSPKGRRLLHEHEVPLAVWPQTRESCSFVCLFVCSFVRLLVSLSCSFVLSLSCASLPSLLLLVGIIVVCVVFWLPQAQISRVTPGSMTMTRTPIRCTSLRRSNAERAYLRLRFPTWPICFERPISRWQPQHISECPQRQLGGLSVPGSPLLSWPHGSMTPTPTQCASLRLTSAVARTRDEHEDRVMPKSMLQPFSYSGFRKFQSRAWTNNYWLSRWSLESLEVLHTCLRVIVRNRDSAILRTEVLSTDMAAKPMLGGDALLLQAQHHQGAIWSYSSRSLFLLLSIYP